MPAIAGTGLIGFSRWINFCSEGRMTPLENSFGGFKDLDIVKYNAGILNNFFNAQKIYLKAAY
jgi:hypothetical protein